MKLEEIFETAGSSVTSVASIGDAEFAASPNQIKIYKRNNANKQCCVATIKRKTGKGWSFLTTSDWGNLQLPHMGNLHNVKSSYNGKKTISSNLPSMLKAWGISYDRLTQIEQNS